MKRLLSMILALAMIMTLIPAAFATEETETATTKTYTFCANTEVKAGCYAGDVSTFGTWGWKVLAVDSAAEGVYKDKTLPYGTESTGGYNYRVLNMQANHIRLEVSRSAGTGAANAGYRLSKIKVAFALEAPENGFYRAESMGGNSNAPAQLYLGKLTESLDIEDYTSDINAFYSPTTYGTDNSWDLKARNELDGIIYSDGTDLAFAIDTGSTTKYLRDLHLTKIEPSLTYTVENDTVGINAKTNSYVTATWTEDESEQSQKVVNSFVTYTSSNEDVATVSDIGEITGVAKGTATITATVGGVDYEKEVAVADLSGVTVEYSFADADYTGTPFEISYKNSNGRLEYDSNTSTYDSIATWNGGYPSINLKSNEYVAYRIRVPKSGQYNVTYAYKDRTMGVTDVYIFPTTVTDIAEYITTTEPVFSGIVSTNYQNGSYADGYTDEVLSVTKKGYEFANAGEYYLVLKKVSGDSRVRPARLTLDGGNTETPMIYADITLGADALEVGGTTTLSQGAAYLSNGTETNATGINYKSTNESVVTISGTAVTSVGGGAAKIQAVRADGYVLDEETITVENKELKEAFAHETTTKNAVAVPTAGVTVNTYAYTVDGTKKNLDDTKTIPAGTAYEVDADKITGMEGYEFLYWAKGATMDKEKQIVSGNAKYSFIPAVEATHLIAVFAPTNAEGTAKAEFYNGNGQLLPSHTVTSGENVIIPELPSMAGYGNATHWELYGDTKEYKKGDSVPLSGSMIFVAQYKELEESIYVTVSGATCDKTVYKYGDVVICTPTDEENFKFWKKDGVIVSMDKEYKFNAWENCTVEAVTGQYYFAGKATKLLIDIINDKFIMAEFIGLSNYGNVVEKGIMIGNKRFAMQQPLATQFTLEADTAAAAATAVAYAIFDDGTMITDK